MKNPGTHDSLIPLKQISNGSLSLQQIPKLMGEREDPPLIVLRSSWIKRDSSIKEINLPLLESQHIALAPARDPDGHFKIPRATVEE